MSPCVLYTLTFLAHTDNEHSSPDTHLIDVVGAAVAGQNKNGQGWIVSNNVFPSSWILVAEKFTPTFRDVLAQCVLSETRSNIAREKAARRVANIKKNIRCIGWIAEPSLYAKKFGGPKWAHAWEKIQ